MKIEKRIKKALFKCLSFKSYLTLVSKSYFISYRFGILKNNPKYKYHHFLKNMINTNDVVLDIGANLGYYSSLFSKWVGKNGFVYSVEPLVQMREVLIKNIRNQKNVKIFPYALGTENKEIRMGNNTRMKTGVIATGSHFVLEDDTKAFDEFTAEMKKGSELFGSFDKLNFIKCDVEGYETVIIPEIKEIIIKHMPLMLIETSGEKLDFILSFLLNIGYHGFVLNDGKLAQVEKAGNGLEDDILFIPIDKIEQYNNFMLTK